MTQAANCFYNSCSCSGLLIYSFAPGGQAAFTITVHCQAVTAITGRFATRLGSVRANGPDDFKPIHPWHLDVNQQHIRFEFIQTLQQFAPGIDGADLKIPGLQEYPKPSSTIIWL